MASVSTFQCRPLLPASLGFQTFCNLKLKTQCLQTSSCLTKRSLKTHNTKLRHSYGKQRRGRKQQEAISYYLDPTRNLHPTPALQKENENYKSHNKPTNQPTKQTNKQKYSRIRITKNA
jgi:hypothetical protein